MTPSVSDRIRVKIPHWPSRVNSPCRNAVDRGETATAMTTIGDEGTATPGIGIAILTATTTGITHRVTTTEPGIIRIRVIDGTTTITTQADFNTTARDLEFGLGRSGVPTGTNGIRHNELRTGQNDAFAKMIVSVSAADNSMVNGAPLAGMNCINIETIRSLA